ncbi:MAG: hypothetical protein NTW56_04830 [Alphaproteobacteria bacterium]|nr:hypothetical protein [Alphaproteobacteria bacterium]
MPGQEDSPHDRPSPPDGRRLPDSPELERLRDSWFDAPDLAAQQAITRRIQAQAMVDVPMVSVGQYFLTTAHRRNVSGILGGVPSFWNVRKS